MDITAIEVWQDAEGTWGYSLYHDGVEVIESGMGEFTAPEAAFTRALESAKEWKA